MFATKTKKNTANGFFSPNPVYDESVNIHVMPQRFHSVFGRGKGTKKTGVFILIAGSLFLVAILIAAYFFVVKDQKLGSLKFSKEYLDRLTNTIKSAENTRPAEETKPQTQEPPQAVSQSAPTNAAEITPVIKNEAATSSLPLEATSTKEVAEKESEPIFTALDSDRDGLSDKEELLLGTNAEKSDSDSDNYNDLSELINMYNPSGAGRLADNPAMKTYENSTFSYFTLYPSVWAVNKFSGDDSLMFALEDKQFVQVIVQPNAEKTDIKDWYIAQFADDNDYASRQLFKDTWDGIMNQDGLTVYLTDKKKQYLVTLTYNLGPSQIAHYKNLFQIMINSFSFE